jgi:antitoxin component of MazEF toxin-antitoxin module
MKTRIVRIGKSQGVRIPKALLEQAGLSGEVEITAEGNALVIRPTAAPNGAEEAAGGKDVVPPLLPYKKLKRLAKKFPPPASWFEEEGKPF